MCHRKIRLNLLSGMSRGCVGSDSLIGRWFPQCLALACGVSLRPANGAVRRVFLRTLRSGFHPASIGARRVPEGNYYPDTVGEVFEDRRAIAVLARPICGVPDGGSALLPGGGSDGLSSQSRESSSAR
jgi:hypothetical protein